MENPTLWIVILLLSSALLTPSIILLSRYNKLSLSLIPQGVSLIVSLVFLAVARIGGGWEAIGYMILSAISLISTALSTGALFAFNLISKKRR